MRTLALVALAIGAASCGGGVGAPHLPAGSLPPGARCTYGGLRPVAFVGDEPSALVVGDVDGDGRTDAILGTQRVDVLVMRDLRAGGFAAPLAIGELRGAPSSFAVDDLDGDGVRDLVESSGIDAAVFWGARPGPSTRLQLPFLTGARDLVVGRLGRHPLPDAVFPSTTLQRKPAGLVTVESVAPPPTPPPPPPPPAS